VGGCSTPLPLWRGPPGHNDQARFDPTCSQSMKCPPPAWESYIGTSGIQSRMRGRNETNDIGPENEKPSPRETRPQQGFERQQREMVAGGQSGKNW